MRLYRRPSLPVLSDHGFWHTARMPKTQPKPSDRIATYSRRMRLRLAEDMEVEARIKGKKLKPVCGDYVTAEPIDNEGDWLITGICDRENELARPNMRGQVSKYWQPTLIF